MIFVAQYAGQGLPCYAQRKSVQTTIPWYSSDKRKGVTTVRGLKQALLRNTTTPLVFVSFSNTECRNPLVKEFFEKATCLWKWKGKNPRHNNHPVMMMVFERPKNANRKKQ